MLSLSKVKAKSVVCAQRRFVVYAMSCAVFGFTSDIGHWTLTITRALIANPSECDMTRHIYFATKRKAQAISADGVRTTLQGRVAEWAALPL